MGATRSWEDEIAGRNPLEDALNGRPWAFSTLLHGIGDALDTEGRPLGERRATSAAKDGVEMELRPCPYKDGRRGHPMNLSAFKQVMAHWDAVLEDVARFQAALPPVHRGRWRALVAVADQLARPAAFLVEVADATAPIPAPMAVGHKLAAGFFAAVNVQRPELPIGPPGRTAERLLAEVEERELLFGASEVCAGPLQLIERAAAALVEPGEGATREPPPRARRALLLAAQLRVGRFAAAADDALERWLLEAAAAGALRPRNDYMRRALAQRRRTLAERPAPATSALLVPPTFRPDLLGALREERAEDALPHGRAGLREALSHPEDAALHPSEGLREELLRRVARHLGLRRRVAAVQWHLEAELRRTFERPLGDALGLNALLTPQVGAGRWVDAVLGHRVEITLAAEPAVTLRNHKRALPLLA